MLWRNDQYQFITHHRRGANGFVIRRKRDNTKLDLASGDLFWDTAGDAPLDLDLDERMQLSKFLDHRQEIKDRVLIRADRDLAVPQIAHLGYRLLGIVPQIEHLLGVAK